MSPFSLDLFSPTEVLYPIVAQCTTVPVIMSPQPCMVPIQDSEQRKESEEEKIFVWMLDELMERGLVNEYHKQPTAYLLSDPLQYQATIKLKSMKYAKVMPRELISKHIYTPDFFIEWNKCALHILHEDPHSIVQNNHVPFFSNYDANNDYYYSIVETKADFDQNNMTRLFSINQKWVLASYGIYVELVKIPSIFKTTFVPLKAMFTPKKGQAKKFKFNALTCDEYLKGMGYDR